MKVIFTLKHFVETIMCSNIFTKLLLFTELTVDREIFAVKIFSSMILIDEN